MICSVCILLFVLIRGVFASIGIFLSLVIGDFLSAFSLSVGIGSLLSTMSLSVDGGLLSVMFSFVDASSFCL